MSTNDFFSATQLNKNDYELNWNLKLLYYRIIHFTDFLFILILILSIDKTSFFLEPYEEKTSYTVLGGVLFHLHLSRWAVYRIVAIDVRSRREGRDLQKVGFYDPIKNQTYLNVPAILYFLEKGTQPTGTVQDILKKAEVLP